MPWQAMAQFIWRGRLAVSAVRPVRLRSGRPPDLLEWRKAASRSLHDSEEQRARVAALVEKHREWVERNLHEMSKSYRDAELDRRLGLGPSQRRLEDEARRKEREERRREARERQKAKARAAREALKRRRGGRAEKSWDEILQEVRNERGAGG